MSWKISTEGDRYYVDAESMPGAQKAFRLAAAAPELLEALEEAVVMLAIFGADTESKTYKRYQDAIAKAKGEAE